MGLHLRPAGKYAVPAASLRRELPVSTPVPAVRALLDDDKYKGEGAGSAKLTFADLLHITHDFEGGHAPIRCRNGDFRLTGAAIAERYGK